MQSGRNLYSSWCRCYKLNDMEENPFSMDNLALVYAVLYCDIAKLDNLLFYYWPNIIDISPEIVRAEKRHVWDPGGIKWFSVQET